MKLLTCVAIVLCLISSGIVSGQEETVNPLVYASEQEVDGNGFSNTYQNVIGLNLSLNNRGHGSGNYSQESVLNLMNSAKFVNTLEESKITSDYGIELKQSMDYVHAPTGFYFGKSFKIGDFRSLGREETCINNYGSNTSMNARFDYIDTLSESLSANLYWKEIESEDEFNYTAISNAKSNLNVDAAFTGRGHIGVLELDDNVHDSNLLIDEDYFGTYSISKNMSHEQSYKLDQSTDHWLPCCSSGFSGMNVQDKEAFKSAEGVFDCTCFKLPEVLQVE